MKYLKRDEYVNRLNGAKALKESVTDDSKKETKKTFYQKWFDDEPGYTGNGAFMTYILKAYSIADRENMKRLESAYPKWFVEKT